MKYNVLITCPQLQETIDQYISLFEDNDIEIVMPKVVQCLREADLLDIIDKFDGVIAGDDEFTDRVLTKGKRLKVLARWGIGMDAVDLQAAQKLGIAVMNTPNVFSDEVADVVMGYIIMLFRGLHRLDTSVRSGGWLKVQGRSLSGKTLGIIGVGNIGSALAKRSFAAGMRSVGYDVVKPSDKVVAETGIQMVSLDMLLETSDIISLNCNLTPDNYHMIGEREFSLMKSGVFIVNVARGPLISEQALIDALEQEKIAGAALDVFEEEPLPDKSLLRKFDNCIFGTHNASNSYEAVLNTNRMSIENLLNALKS